MLPKRRRFSAGDLRSWKSERTIKAPLVIVRAARAKRPPSRAAVVVSLKVEKRANRRNAIRRTVYGALEQYREGMMDMVFLMQPRAAQASPQEIRVAVERVIRELKN